MAHPLDELTKYFSGDVQAARFWDTYFRDEDTVEFSDWMEAFQKSSCRVVSASVRQSLRSHLDYHKKGTVEISDFMRFLSRCGPFNKTAVNCLKHRARPPNWGEVKAAKERKAEREAVLKDFRRMDMNKDGSVTKTEWIAAGYTPESFEMVDIDGTGVITSREARIWQGLPAEMASKAEIKEAEEHIPDPEELARIAEQEALARLRSAVQEGSQLPAQLVANGLRNEANVMDQIVDTAKTVETDVRKAVEGEALTQEQTHLLYESVYRAVCRASTLEEIGSSLPRSTQYANEAKALESLASGMVDSEISKKNRREAGAKLGQMAKEHLLAGVPDILADLVLKDIVDNLEKAANGQLLEDYSYTSSGDVLSYQAAIAATVRENMYSKEAIQSVEQLHLHLDAVAVEKHATEHADGDRNNLNSHRVMHFQQMKRTNKALKNEEIRKLSEVEELRKKIEEAKVELQEARDKQAVHKAKGTISEMKQRKVEVPTINLGPDPQDVNRLRQLRDLLEKDAISPQSAELASQEMHKLSLKFQTGRGDPQYAELTNEAADLSEKLAAHAASTTTAAEAFIAASSAPAATRNAAVKAMTDEEILATLI